MTDSVTVQVDAENTGADKKTTESGWDVAPLSTKAACSAETKAATLSWSKLVVTAKDVKGNEKKILQGVDGFIEPRHMLAIMGPSGCGKTTLLDTLAGRLGGGAVWDGEIRVNGHKSKLSYGRSAYVTQDEVLLGTLSVRETIMFAAQLRLPPTMTHEEKVEAVNRTIAEMGLEKNQNTAIGNWHIRGVSGGQRRRVSIACELVLEPSLLFLDEPTSGLDSASAYYVMDSVRRLCEACRTIVSVIHQPSSEVFGLFDKLCLLSAGEVVYFGDAGRAVDMFSAAGLSVPAMRNPSDHFLHCINKDFELEGNEVQKNIENLVKTYNASKMRENVIERVKDLHSNPGTVYESSSSPPSWSYQTRVLTWRTFLNNLRNIGVFWLRLGMYIGLCILVGFVYFQLGSDWKDVFSRAALLFFVVAFLTFMSIAAFPAFIEDMKVFSRERLNGYYGVSQFTVANTMASLPFIFLIAVVSSIPVYWIAALYSSAQAFVYFILNLFLALVVVESIMMAIAPMVPHYLMGIAAGAGILGMYMVVCGFFQPLDSLPQPILRYPLSYIAYHTYSFSGFMFNEFSGNQVWQAPCAAQQQCPPGQDTVDNAFVLSYYEVLDINKWVNLAILAGMAFFYRILFFLTLKYKESKSH